MTKTISLNNPLLQTSGLPRFDQIRPQHVVPGVRQALAQATEKLEALEADLAPSWEGLLQPLEAIDLLFEYAWHPVQHLLSVKNSEALRQAHDAVLGEVVAFGLRLRQSKPIYDALKTLKHSESWQTLSNAQQRLIDQMLQEAKHAGVALAGAAKARFIEIEKALSQLSTDFSNAVLDARKTFELVIQNPNDTQGWPNTLKQISAQSYNQANEQASATPETGPWRITLDYPSAGPFLDHSRNRRQREHVFKAMASLASLPPHDNTPRIDRILGLRREKAKLLGFDTYAQLSLSTKMAGTVEAVERMFAELQNASKAAAEQDHNTLQQLAKTPLAHWDVRFWVERLRERRFDYTDEQLRPYFPLPRVLEGLFGLCKKLFGIDIKEANDPAPAWHPDVRFYHVFDEDGAHRASFYLDPYSRPQEKRGGAWMNNCLKRRRVNGQLQVPVIFLICNGTPPVGEKPSLMSFGEVLTLFHEFGHGLQGMLTTVDVPGVSGVNGVEWDAVEIASQFMENWCYHKPTLIGMTAHVKTGQSLPDDLFDKLSASRTFRSGSGMLRQLKLGMTDMALHHQFDPGGPQSVLEVQQQIAQIEAMPPYEGDRLLCHFSHIFGGGYAAGYYSYKWAEVLSADAFAAFEEVGLDDEAAIARMGHAFRNTLLAQGGSRHPMEVFVEFRGREPSTEALLRHSGL